MKSKKKKGFTLIELIIVIAIFSIIMYSVIQLIDPVSKFFVRSSNFENSTACVDNMKRCIEGNLKYADRVRAYSGYLPYDTSGAGGYKPSPTLEGHVSDFYNDFFADRKFLDSSGIIYVLCFDNTELVSDTGLAGYGTISDFTDHQLNTGKLVLYKFSFDNYNSTFDEAAEVLASLGTPAPSSGLSASQTITPWAVNQKLYGPFEYKYKLGTSDSAFTTASTSATTTSLTTTSTTTSGTGVTVTPGPTPAAITFNPQDCTILITANEIRRDNTIHGLKRMAATDTNTASFAMKNVLDGQKKFATPSFDYKTKCMGDESLPDHVYTSDMIPRYTNLDVASTTAFDGFYFIYTIPETTNSNPINYSNQSGINTTVSTSATTTSTS